MILSFWEGFVLQASLILAFGAQNLFVLESGLKKDNHFIVAFICTLCDFILILIGLMGFSYLFNKFPNLKVVFGLLGVAFLTITGLKKILAQKVSNEQEVKSNPPKSSKLSTVFKTLGFSLLNPLVYVDTVFLIGGTGARFENFNFKISFWLGASLCSGLWFFGLTYLSGQMELLRDRPYFFDKISKISGILLLVFALKMTYLSFLKGS
ncbi:LysE family transporter [Bacteriovoracales bacterium]|nr:LysE family transporter [Bacteriovoracales bacterium]